MPSQDDYQAQWQNWLHQYAIPTEPSIQARTFRRGHRTKSQPVLLKCADGNEYMVKGQQAGRQIVNDHIVARLGKALGAPVGEPQIIEIPHELIEIEPNLQHITPGTAHGSRIIPHCFDQYTLIATEEPENRSRLMLLAILYGWVVANDHQFLFNNTPPRLVHSVDHGHFFPEGSEWTLDSLRNAPNAKLDPYFEMCQFTPAERAEGRKALEQLTHKDLVAAVATPPDQWQITIEERVELVEYLANRQQALLTGELVREEGGSDGQ